MEEVICLLWMPRSWDGCLIDKKAEEGRYYESITGKRESP